MLHPRRHPDVSVVTFSEMGDAVGAAARMVDALGSSHDMGLGADSIQAQVRCPLSTWQEQNSVPFCTLWYGENHVFFCRD